MFVPCIRTLISTPVGHHNNDPTEQSQSAKNRRKRNGVMFFLRCLDRTDVHDFLLCCVGQALIRQREKPYNDQCYSQDCSSVHCASEVAVRELFNRLSPIES